jgi:hypothetical protein
MSNPEVGADGWPVGEKRYHCANCDYAIDGKPGVCKHKKRVGIGYCRDHSAFAFKENKAITEVKE